MTVVVAAITIIVDVGNGDNNSDDGHGCGDGGGGNLFGESFSNLIVILDFNLKFLNILILTVYYFLFII